MWDKCIKKNEFPFKSAFLGFLHKTNLGAGLHLSSFCDLLKVDSFH